ncbi:hypothetical protein HG535_0D01700 [Zygotorulaspora mrakii]|uniref:SH3 domain-containing protein n=1 Tax=Zygotorulaspora mrakii TaxID=42260 RepID=A0A7H9B401_ZYGMR|nr:uncharacterized protein HG535_0D01700 [Zygotorulaspora mrakii]QLG72462.1 hypothetical protein HG535_0D01700 [Zygotorulaspora mrakii]
MSVSVQQLAPPFKVKARYGWSGQARGDLGFLEGDVMEVTKITGDWFYGRLLRNRKCSGYFPNNFVNVLGEKMNQNNANETKVYSKSQPTSPVKVVIPPIPARLNPRSSVSSSSSSSSLRDVKKKDSSMYKISQHHSTPNLPEVHVHDKLDYGRYKNTRTKKRTSPEFNRYINEADNIPPLPPIPCADKHHGNLTQQKMPKSSSLNDVSTTRSARDPRISHNGLQAYNGDRNYYYSPSKRSSVTDDSNSSDLFSNSKYMDGSTTSSEDSFALMSDFSATSAGSLARHRFAQSFSDSLERSQTFSSLESINSGSGNGKMGGILRKLMPRGHPNYSNSPNSPISPTAEYPKLPDIQNLKITSTHDDARDWLTVKAQLNRSRSLTKYEKHPRYIRVLEQNHDLVLHPQDAVSNGLNTNEVRYNGQPGLIDIELAGLNLEYIDDMTRKRCIKDGSMTLSTWSQTTFSARYSTTAETLRGIYIFCAETFELVDDNGGTDFSKPPRDLEKILYSRHCTPFQLTCLFKELSKALGITCEMVYGFLKTPVNDNSDYKYNHCWLRVLVNKEWRFIDIILGNISNPIHEFVNNKKITKAEDDYFLVEPLQFIYTHIPQREYEQHIIPSIDRLSALYLPLVFPSFFKYGLSLYKFSTALSYLEDSEIYECSLEIPSDVELFASVVVSTDDVQRKHSYGKMELALVQVKSHKSDSTRRIAVVKAVLPPGVKKGSLYLHAGLRGEQTSVVNVHPLSMMVPLYHSGTEMKYEFTVRKPSESIQKVEMYIVEPQNRYLFQNNEYNFEIIQKSFDGIIYERSSPTRNRRQPMIIKAPSGKRYEFEKNDPHFAYGTSRTTITVKEPGIWKALVAADSGCGSCTFAEWLCL